jgi:cardiolipin synthase A/B
MNQAEPTDNAPLSVPLGGPERLLRARGPGASLPLARALVRQAERAMLRASDAVLVRGNRARLLVDGPEAFEAWVAAIESARRWVHLENYILRDDRIGRRFRDLLVARARDGVRVRVLYDWMGCWATPRRYWKPLYEAGVEVLPFAPPRLGDPLHFVRRDHRKVVAVDGVYASVAGMCIGDEWAGVPDEGIPPWRDTGVEFIGPVAAVINRAFARTWTVAGGRLPADEMPDPDEVARHGDVSVRVVEGEPGRSRIYRLSQFVSVGVERRLWITDPYFVAPPAMAEALASAARDGVDVRIIVPAHNNWPIVGGMSRAGYRMLLEAGVRLFEWQGPMIHAKTSVADGIWSRIGSTNLNLASLLANWELDVAILDRDFASEMEQLFLTDMHSSLEVRLRRLGASVDQVLERVPVRDVSQTVAELESAQQSGRRAPRGSRLGRLVGRLARAITVLARALLGQRIIGREDTGWIGTIAVTLLLLAVLGFWEPRVVAWPVGFLLFWIAIATLLRLAQRA